MLCKLCVSIYEVIDHSTISVVQACINMTPAYIYKYPAIIKYQLLLPYNLLSYSLYLFPIVIFSLLSTLNTHPIFCSLKLKSV